MQINWEWQKVLNSHESQIQLKFFFGIRSLLVTVGLSLTSNSKYLTKRRFPSEILAYRKMKLWIEGVIIFRFKMSAKMIDNSTQCSQAVSHPSTDQAQCCLTSVIGRELVVSTWYGRCREQRCSGAEKRGSLGR